MPRMAEVWRAVFPAATELVPVAADAIVSWARVMKPRVPAFDALEAGDLAIVPEGAVASIGQEGVEPALLVDQLARARAVGILLVRDTAADRADSPPRATTVVAEIVEQARRTGPGVLRVEQADAADLERGTLGFLLGERAELERQAARLEDALGRVALEGHEPEALCGVIGGFLGRAVALEDARGRSFAVHAPPAAAPDAVRYLASGGGVALRIPLPGHPGDADRGRLASARGPAAVVLLGAREASELERVALTRVAPLLALGLTRRPPTAGAPDLGRDTLPVEGPPWVVLMARQIRPSLPVSLDDREALREAIAALAPPRRLVLRGDASSLELRAVIAPGGDDPRGVLLAQRIATLADRPVALSRPFHEREERASAEAEARATLEAAELAPEPPRVALAERRAAYRLLGTLHELPDGLRQATALLAPVLALRPRQRDAALGTLRAVLERPADPAAALGIHRNTLAYRVHRIEHLTGWHLADPELRVALIVALRIMHNAQGKDSDQGG